MQISIFLRRIYQLVFLISLFYTVLVIRTSINLDNNFFLFYLMPLELIKKKFDKLKLVPVSFQGFIKNIN